MTLAGIEPAAFQFVAQHINHCATAFPIYIYEVLENMSKKWKFNP